MEILFMVVSKIKYWILNIASTFSNHHEIKCVSISVVLFKVIYFQGSPLQNETHSFVHASAEQWSSMHLQCSLCLYFSVLRSLQNILGLWNGELTLHPKLGLEQEISLTAVAWYLVRVLKFHPPQFLKHSCLPLVAPSHEKK